MDGRIPARIIATHKDRYEIMCDKGSGFAKIKRDVFMIIQIQYIQQLEILY